MPFAGEIQKINYRIPGIIFPIRQSKTMACWATVFTMMYNWKNKKQLPVEEAVGLVGKKYTRIYNLNSGLMPWGIRKFADRAGLVARYEQKYSLKDWEKMLRSYGPLWVTIGVEVNKDIRLHAVLFCEMEYHPEDGQCILYVDPAIGKATRKKVGEMTEEYHAGAKDKNIIMKMINSYSQVLHY